MPILKERQGVGIYSALLKQNGGNASFSGSPVYRCSLSRVQAGSGFLRNTFNKLKHHVKNIAKSQLAKNIGAEVIKQAKREIPSVLAGEKNVKDAIKDAVSAKNVIDTISTGVKKTIQSGSGQAIKRKIENMEYDGDTEEENPPPKKMKGGNQRIPQKSQMKIVKKSKPDVFSQTLPS